MLTSTSNSGPFSLYSSLTPSVTEDDLKITEIVVNKMCEPLRDFEIHNVEQDRTVSIAVHESTIPGMEPQNTDLVGVSAGQVIRYDGTKWVGSSLPGGGGIAVELEKKEHNLCNTSYNVVKQFVWVGGSTVTKATILAHISPGTTGWVRIYDWTNSVVIGVISFDDEDPALINIPITGALPSADAIFEIHFRVSVPNRTIFAESLMIQ